MIFSFKALPFHYFGFLFLLLNINIDTRARTINRVQAIAAIIDIEAEMI